MKNNNKKIVMRSISIFLLYFSILTSAVYAQNKSQFFQGKVVDTFGQAISDVRVAVQDGYALEYTDKIGAFAIESQKSDVLVFTAQGYKELYLNLFALKDLMLTVTLEKATFGVDNMVALPYMSQIKSNNITTAMGTISGKRFESFPGTSLNNSMLGAVAGLIGIQGDYSPNSEKASDLNIRGKFSYNDNRVLVLVDGVEKTFESMNADDIESVTVLKDAASCAIYGNRGAGGVLLLTTKRGSKGKTSFKIRGRQGISEVIQLPRLLTAVEYMQLYNEAASQDGTPEKLIPLTSIDKYKDPSRNMLVYPDVNYMDEFFGKYAQTSNYSFSANGGNKTAAFYVALNYVSQNGAFNHTNQNSEYNTQPTLKRYTLTTNVDINISPTSKVAFDLRGIVTDNVRPNGVGSTNDIFLAYKNKPHLFPIWVGKDSLGAVQGTTNNPMSTIAYSGILHQMNRDLAMQGTFEQKLDFITKGLKFKLLGAFSVSDQYGYGKSQTAPLYMLNTVLGEIIGATKIRNEATIKNVEGGIKSFSSNTTFNALITYNQSFGKHNIDALAGIQKRTDNRTGYLAYPDPRQGALWSASYNYNEKYLLQLAGSYYGWNNFAPGNQYVLYPSVSVGWVLTKEKFIPQNKLLSYAKIRASWGIAGSDYSYIGRRFPYQTGVFEQAANVQFGTTPVGSIYREASLGSNSLTTEKKETYNLGFDLQLFKNKLFVSVDVFRDKGFDLLSPGTASMPGIYGASYTNLNFGEVKNKGWEIAAGYRESIGEDFSFTVDINLAKQKNEIISINEGFVSEPDQSRIGRPVDGFTRQVFTGFYSDAVDVANSIPQSLNGRTAPGDAKYLDANQDGVVDQFDARYGQYNGFPQLSLGSNIGLNYKNFDLSVFFQGLFQRTISINNYDIYANFWNNTNVYSSINDRWKPNADNTNALYPRVTLQENRNNTAGSTLWELPGWFFRIRNIDFGYTLPKALTAKINMEKLRVSVGVNNAYQWDATRGLADVEVPNAGYYYYPKSRIYSFALDVTF